MTVDFQKEAIQLRSELAMIRGLLHQMPSKLEPFPFTNLVQNGGFDVDANWTKGAGWTISGGVASHASGSFGSLDMELFTPLGVYLKVSASGVYTSGGSLQLLDNGAVLDEIALTGEMSATWVSDGTPIIRFGAGSGVWSIDNVSLWEADPADDAPWLRLNYGYSVKECGGFVVRDNGILHPPEWEEINRCGQRFIKPLVAPGHDTDFLIFAGVAK